MPPKTVHTFSITPHLHKRFAELSGDWNPIHVDPLRARRTQIGRPIVHGVHSVLRMLETLAKSDSTLPLPTRISVFFPAPVLPGDSVEVSIAEVSQNKIHLRACVGVTVVVDARIELSGVRCPVTFTGPVKLERNRVCRTWTLPEMASANGIVFASSRAVPVARAFPETAKWLGVATVSGLICLSKLVGMECPGRHSILAGFDIEITPESLEPRLAYRVVKFNEQFRSLKIDADGFGVRGGVQALVANPPVAQPSTSDLSGKVSVDEFSGQRALIVGGSRGLGELTAKLIAAGGGVPVITYATGKKDAERVAVEIRHAGGRCEIRPYNVLSPAAPQLRSLKRGVSHLYYYGTPPIFGVHSNRHSPNFEARRLDIFKKYYVNGFDRLCRALLKSGRSLAACYPSSVAIGENRPEMKEYVEAKAAGEKLCAELSASFPRLRIVVERLPRMQTDQTSTPVPTMTADAVEVLLPIVRKLSALSVEKDHRDSST